jgi:predicted DNA-binding transcriptional regulator AlpA
MRNGVNRVPLIPPKRPAPPATEQRLLDPRATAQYLGGISLKTLSRITAPAGDLPAVRIGSRTVRYDLRDLEEWIARHKQAPIAALIEAPVS